MECQYALMTFGIHRSYIPFDESGCIQLWKIRNHLDKIQALELQAVTTLLIPTASDVLMGRGKPFQSFPGKWHNLIVVFSLAEFHSTF